MLQLAVTVVVAAVVVVVVVVVAVVVVVVVVCCCYGRPCTIPSFAMWQLRKEKMEAPRAK